jgi:lipopolysaccharide assembly outer membrane protein LptD (OstA)
MNPLRTLFGGRPWALALPAGGLLALLVAVALAQPAPPPDVKAETPEATAPPADEPKESDEPVHIEHADLLNYDPETNIYYLSGSVHFRHKDTHLYCDRAEYNEDEDTARATGNLKIVQPETTVTGDLIVADFDEEVADITGNVRLVTQKKKEEKAADAAPPAEGRPEAEEEKPGRWEEHKEKLTTVTCEKLRYWYEEKHALATGTVVAEQEDKKCFADEAEYLEKDDLLTLKGDPVRVVKTNGDHFETPWVKVEVEGERFWTGGFSGVFKREKKDEEKGGGEPAPPPAPPAPPAEAPPP